MPRQPSYCHHKGSGQSYVTINGLEKYLGKYDSPDSYEKYDQEILKWRQQHDVSAKYSLTVGQLTLLYLTYCEKHYRKHGAITSEVSAIKIALRHLNKGFRNLVVSEFSPKKLKSVQESMISACYVRTSINRHIGRIRRMFKWGISEELVPPVILAALETVSGLRAGRSETIESEPVKPVPEAHIEAVQPHVSKPVWGLIQFQLFTGARPGEARILRGCDLNIQGKIWEYTPDSHKTEHHGMSRMIFIGPKGQETLRKFLKKDLGEYLFSPQDVRRGRSRPFYSKFSYGRAINNACKKASIPHWTPNQLRHNAATRIRKEFGLEAAQVVLGHANANVTEVYAERDLHLAKEIITKIG